MGEKMRLFGGVGGRRAAGGRGEEDQVEIQKMC